MEKIIRENRKQVLNELIESYRDHWQPDYQKEVSQEECAGIMLADYFGWNGKAILIACGEGLEDANFHKEAKIVRELAKQY